MFLKLKFREQWHLNSLVRSKSQPVLFYGRDGANKDVTCLKEFKFVFLFKNTEKITVEGCVSISGTLDQISLCGISYRRHFVWGYFMCMATKPTAFHSIPPKRSLIYLKTLNFCHHWKYHSIKVLQCRISIRNMK